MYAATTTLQELIQERESETNGSERGAWSVERENGL
jgi:hypothetical protein